MGGNGTLWALREVSFEIRPGETVGLIGANGAGKSTALKLIGRVIAPTSGQVRTVGRVTALIELGSGFHPELTGRENVYLSGALAGMGRKQMKRRFDSIVDFSGLEEFVDVPVKRYSSGMFARLAFALSVHLDPEVLLVDEVLAVGDYAFQRKCLDQIAALQRAGVTIFFVSHQLDSVRSLCTRALWLDHGRILADGSAEAVVGRYLDQALKAESGRLLESAGPRPDQRWGSRTIEIREVQLESNPGAEQAIFETGQPFHLRMTFEAHQPVPSPVFGMAIHRQDGLHICGPNTAFAGLELPTVRGRGTVTYTLDRLPLLEGLYEITVAVVNQEDTEIFDYHDRAYRFRVVNRDSAVRERFGILAAGGDWTVQLSPPE